MTAVPQQLQPAPAVTGDPAPQRLEICVSVGTFVKVFAALLTAYAIYRLWPLLLMVFLAVFLAVTLHAFVEWLQGKGMKRWVSLLIVIGSFLTLLGVGVAIIVPDLMVQGAAFHEKLPMLREEALKQLPTAGGIRQNIERMMGDADWSKTSSWVGHVFTAGGFALGGLSQIALLLVIALYLLIDGHKTYDWLLAFFSPLKRAKLRITSKAISQVIFGYVSGQFTTSALVTVYTYVVLSLLHVPAALMLSILAGVFDILPILGFFIAATPAVLLALSVSPHTAFLVLCFYLLFHLIEAYYIVPTIFGKHLRVSTLTVLISLLAGTLLAGIPGALASLPIIASYTASERIWLKPFLRDGVSEKHELQEDQEFGDRQES